MVRAQGMALAPWNVLAGGKIRTDAEEARRRETGEKGVLDRRTYVACVAHGRICLGRATFVTGLNWERDETQKKVSAVLETVASEVGASNIQAGT